MYQEAFAGQRWQDLVASGARPQRPLWASTGVKDPAYSDTRYVDQLVVAGTVNTVPEPTLNAAADHAEIAGDTVTGTAEDAQRVFTALADVGIDVDDVFAVLEREGVDKFDKSWAELLETVNTQLVAVQED